MNIQIFVTATVLAVCADQAVLAEIDVSKLPPAATKQGVTFDKDIKPLEAWEHPFGKINQENPNGARANYRTAGLADMVMALIEGRDARCSLDRTLHGVDVMTSILKSGEEGRFIDLTTTCTQPAALGIEEAQALLK